MSHHKIALVVIAVTLALDAVAGVLYAHLTGIPVLPPARGPYDGFDWAVGVMFTTGDAGPPPLTRAQHWLWLGVHLSIIPLGAAALSLVTSGLTSARVKRHLQPTQRIVADLYHHHTGKDHPDAPKEPQ